MIKNIMLMRASAVITITSSRRASLKTSKAFGTPAMTDPMVINTAPAMTALMVPDRLKPAISSNFEIGVTR
jgi:hypothetical protein